MTRPTRLYRQVALAITIVMVCMVAMPTTAYAAIWKEKRLDYMELLRRGTVNEKWHQVIEKNERSFGTGIIHVLSTMGAQLDFLENYDKQSVDDTNLMLSSYQEALPIAESLSVTPNVRILYAVIELEWIKLRMARYTGTITNQQYEEQLTVIVENEIKRHDEADMTLSDTSLEVLFDYCAIMLANGDDEALAEVWKRGYTGNYSMNHIGSDSSSTIMSWYMAHKLNDRPWYIEQMDKDYSSVVLVALDNRMGQTQRCRIAADGTIFYPLPLLMEACLYQSGYSDSPNKLSLSTIDGSDIIELEIGSNVVKHNGEAYTLDHPVKSGFFVPEDFFEECFPQVVVTEGLYPLHETMLPPDGRILQADTYPGTSEQLTFALGLAAPINIFNLGKLGSPGRAPYFQRDKLTMAASVLVPVYGAPRYYRYHPSPFQAFVSSPVQSIRDEVLPSSWGVYDRNGLMEAISGLTIGGGHNAIYQSVVEMTADPTNPALLTAYEGITPEEIAEIVEMYRWHLERWELPESGIAAWDISRAVQLTQWGALCGYLTVEESATLQLSLAATAQQMYGSWEEFGKGYLAGYEMFLGEAEVASKDTEIASEMGDRAYIISEIYKDNAYRNVSWELDLAPMPPREPKLDPDALPEPASSLPSSISEEVTPPEQPQGTSSTLIIVVVALLLSLCVVAVIVVKKKRQPIATTMGNDAQPTETKTEE